MDAAVAERSGGELEITEVAGEDAGGKGHSVVDQVNHDGRSGQVEEEAEFDTRSQPEPLEERQVGFRENLFEPRVSRVCRRSCCWWRRRLFFSVGCGLVEKIPLGAHLRMMNDGEAKRGWEM